MGDIFFTSDLHFRHEMVAKLRGFKTVQKHDEVVTESLTVPETKGGRLYMLGDFCLDGKEMKKFFISQLAEHYSELHFIWGNHDKGLKAAIEERPRAIHSTSHIKNIKVNGQRIVLCHFPFLTWEQSHRGWWHLHGHCHGNLPTDKTRYRLDVGWDVWSRPVSFFDIEKQFYKHEVELVSHHMPEHYDLEHENRDKE